MYSSKLLHLISFNLQAFLYENTLPVFVIVVDDGKPCVLNGLAFFGMDQSLPTLAQSAFVSIKSHRKVVDEVVTKKVLELVQV